MIYNHIHVMSDFTAMMAVQAARSRIPGKLRREIKYCRVSAFAFNYIVYRPVLLTTNFQVSWAWNCSKLLSFSSRDLCNYRKRQLTNSRSPAKNLLVYSPPPLPRYRPFSYSGIESLTVSQ